MNNRLKGFDLSSMGFRDKEQKNKWTQRYNIRYKKYGFFTTENANVSNPFCVVCEEKLGNEAVNNPPIVRDSSTTTKQPNHSTSLN